MTSKLQFSAPRHRTGLVASVSGLALLTAMMGPAAAQSPVFARRGADPGVAAARAAQAAGVDAARAATSTNNAVSSFARAAQASAAASAVQAAARAAANASAGGVPNGLAPGGLVPVTGDASLWIGAGVPVQTTAADASRVNVTVQQIQQRAVLTWSSFNVGQQTTLNFDQSAGGTNARNWSVLNRVEDPSLAPSRVLGSIKAQGAVYVINRNGIVFEGSSQVNVGTLIASALDVGSWGEARDVRNAKYLAGILNRDASAGNMVPTFSLDDLSVLGTTGAPRRVAVDVLAGAQLTASDSGQVILAAPQVVNRGSITTPAGQTILAAGLGLRLDPALANTPTSPNIGLMVESLRRGPTDDVRFDSLANEARNEGIVSASRGNITLAGTNVSNLGVLTATTGNDRNGSIILTARDIGGAVNLGSADAALYRLGTVTLGQGSLATVGGETASDQPVYDNSATFKQSSLALTGAAVLLGRDALVYAPAGSLRISGDITDRGLFPDSVARAGRLQVVSLDAGATIDLAGLKDVQVPIARNFIKVEARSAELQDSPLQRAGLLYQMAQRAESVTVDIRTGTPLLSWQAAAALIARSVAERQAVGGKLDVVAERVFTAQGSLIDVSGGYLTYVGGLRPQTTRLQGADGKIYDIGSAPADLTYTALASQFTTTQSRWGINRLFTSGLRGVGSVYEAGYVEGLDAGAVSIAGRWYGDGVVQGGVTIGTRQALASAANDGNALTSSDMPFGGSVNFLGNGLDRSGAVLARTTTTGIGALVNPTLVDTVTVPLPTDLASQLVLDPATPASADTRYVLSSGALPATRFDSQISTRNLTNRGFASITIAADGKLSVPQGVTVQLAAGGSFSANVGSAEIAGSILVPGGSIAITANAGDRIAPVAESLHLAPTTWSVVDAAPTTPGDGRITIASGAVLSTAGRWSNDWLAPQLGAAFGGSGQINGGSISLATRWTPVSGSSAIPAGATVDAATTPVLGHDIVLGQSAVLDVSGGGFLAPNTGAMTTGKGGQLSLATYAGRSTSPTGGLGDPTGSGLPLVGVGQAGVRIAGDAASIRDDGAVLRGFGTAGPGRGASNGAGGIISLTTPSIVIGREPTAAEAEYGAFRADPTLLAQAGFGDIRLTATTAGGLPFLGLPAGSISIAPGSVVAPVAAQWLVRPQAPLQASGAPAAAFGSAATLAAPDRAATRLTLTAQNALELGGPTTELRADPGGARSDTAALVSLTAARGMLVEGTISAPAGQIRITGNGNTSAYTTPTDQSPVREFDGTTYGAGEGTWVAGTARLLAPGVAQQVLSSAGLTAGGVRAGGTVTLSESRGTLVVEAGALIDVSGVSGRTDTLLVGGRTPAAGRRGSLALASDAGSISLNGARGLFLDGTLQAMAGGPGAKGGNLTITGPSPQPYQSGISQLSSVPNGLTGTLGIMVVADAVTLPDGASRAAGADPTLVRQADGSWRGDYTDRAWLSASRIEGSGIDRLTLFSAGQPITLVGQVALNVPRMVQLDAATIAAAPGRDGNAPNARISTAYLALNGQASGTAVPLSGAALAGSMTLSGTAVDVFGGVTLDGAAQTTLASGGDLRLVGTQYIANAYGQVQGALRSAGNLTLQAGQVYTSTASTFTVTAENTLTIQGLGGATPQAPLSAASTLTLAANSIVQAGVLRAPQGQIFLQPGSDILFAAGSLTSVSAEGRSVPLGQIDGFNYQVSLLTTNPSQPNGVTAAPEKLIDVSGPRVTVAAGAQLDASGGGNLLAYTFTAGPGGSRDVLARAIYSLADGGVTASSYLFADKRDVFAVLPGAQAPAAPLSPYILDSGTSLGRGEVTALSPSTGVNRYGQQVGGTLPWVGDQITIAQSSPALAAGTYTLLPGRYAMLPGAVRVTIAPAATTPAVVSLASAATEARDGSWLVQGTRSIANTGVREAAPRSVTLQTQDVWSQYSSLTTTTANDYFPARAARLDVALDRLPIDAGRLSLSASQSLAMDGTTLFNHPAGGRGGQVDISSSAIAITPGGAAFATPGTLVLSDATLSALGAETLTIGGTRTRTDAGDQLVVQARSVILASGASVTAPEVVLLAKSPSSVATDGVQVQAGASLVASGALSGNAPASLLIGSTTVYNSRGVVTAPAVDGNGALLRVSVGGLLPVTRVNLASASGTTPLSVGADAVLGGRTVTLDATGTMQVASSAGFRATNLDFGAAAILLGQPGAGLGGNALVLRSAWLAQLNSIANLSLRSTSSIDVHGGVALAASGNLTLDAAALRGFDIALTGGGTEAGSLAASVGGLATLRNSNATLPGGGATGSGALAIDAGGILLGGGSTAVQGFATAALSTGGELSTTGIGDLNLAGQLAMTAARVSSGAGADFSITATGAMSLAAPATATTTALGTPAMGGRLSLTGSDLTLATAVVNRSGDLNLTATSGNLTLAGGASIDLSGYSRVFFDQAAYASGGRATLVASAGNVVIAPGVGLDVSAPTGISGVTAGSLRLTAQRGSAEASGLVLRGTAADAGAGGSFTLDTLAAADLGAVNARLDAAGFDGARTVWTRTGNLALAAGQTMRASQVGLTADGGTLTIAGSIDTRGAKGGDVRLYGATGLTLASGASISAGGTAAGQPGGVVELGTNAGPLQLAGSSIDVSGNDATRGSLVQLRLPVAQMAGSVFTTSVTGARLVQVEPYAVLTSATIATTAITNTFNSVSSQNFQASRFSGFPSNWRVTPGVELRNAAGDLTLPAASAISLLTSRTSAGDPGILTLRAAGDLVLLNSLSDGFATAVSTARISDTRSWSYRLVGGADMASADPMATVDAGRLGASGGNILVGRVYTYDPTVSGSSPATSPVTIRTGTGAISLGASRDVLLRDPDAAIYTAGRPLADPTTVVGVAADGSTGTGRFVLPQAPSYAAYSSLFTGPTQADPAPAPPATAYGPTYSEGGGNLRVTAGRDILQTITDAAGNNAGQAPSEWLWRQGAVNTDGQFMYRPALPRRSIFDSAGASLRPVVETSSQTSWWVNFSLFRQGFGVLGGGDARIIAGRDLRASVSVPTNARVGGGLAPSYSTTYTASAGRLTTLTGLTPNGGTEAVLAVNGGGDLDISVGRNIIGGSQFLVGRGNANLRVGGSLTSSSIGGISPVDLSPIHADVGTMLALGDAQVRVQALGSIATGIYDPLQVPGGREQAISDAWGYSGPTATGMFRTYTERSLVTLSALGGDVNLQGTLGSAEPYGALQVLQTAARSTITVAGAGPGGRNLVVPVYRNLVSANLGTLFNNVTDLTDRTTEHLPASVGITAFNGNIGFAQAPGSSGLGRIGVSLAPVATGQLEMLAAGSVFYPNISLPDGNPAAVSSPYRPYYDAPAASPGGLLTPDGLGYVDSATTVPAAAAPLRAGDPSRALIYALGGNIPFATITSGKRIGLRAGGDITDLTLTVQHGADGDYSFVWAGRDIRSSSSAELALEQQGVTMDLRGPGRLQVLAGRDIDQIRTPAQPSDPSTAGLANNGIHALGNQAEPLYAQGSGTLDVLFGLGTGGGGNGGVDSSGFLSRVLDPTFSQGRYEVQLNRTANGGATWAIREDSPTATPSATLGSILALPGPERLGLAIDLAFREISASGAQAARGGSSQGNYTRGFSAIASLFPYGGYSGRFNLQGTYLRTDQGGDINVLGPGGDFFLGGTSATADRYPDRIGVLTLGYGSVNIFAHGDIQLGQSRAFTVDGGDILMWSSTKDINAGLGAKTARYIPPYSVTYNVDGGWSANRSGLVTGSGIATFTPFTPLGEVASLLRTPANAVEAAAQADEARRRTTPSISLIAPVGIVDFGDAGVRSAGNLVVAAQTVLNAANVQVSGASTGVPVVASTNVVGAVAASASAGQGASAGQEAARQAARSAEARPGEAPAIISVDVIGVGGSEQDAQ